MKKQNIQSQKKILIANRGEIAARVAKAILEMGHIPVGFFTDSEPNAYHLAFCQEWIYLSGNTHQETYLNIEKIVSLAKEHKIEAVHPGYGFLSENTLFAKALEEKGIIFIGPNPKSILLMGDKAISKQEALKAKIPVVPGPDNPIHTKEEALSVAKEIGFPVLLKAVAGGGGRGMRICHTSEDVLKNFETVQREALSSFGKADLLLEKYIQNPRHIEVQVVGDKHGKVVHFFERECSIQRRHQKIIEEAPSPFVGEDQKLRHNICETAVRLAKHVGYDSAGTVEFIMGEDRSFYFLEMNTRIQVEHPITEEITGVDLVSLMIEIAFGAPLPFQSQEEITLRGHSIECRICVEHPFTFLPSPGTITATSWKQYPGIRFDHCLYSGLVVAPDFDPMLGKMIATSLTREKAIKKMKMALSALFIEGVFSNISLLLFVLGEEDFLKGNFSTHYLEQKILKRPKEELENLFDQSKETFLSLLEKSLAIECSFSNN